METQHITIQDIAKKAGVSTATVSRMINDNGFVSIKTRDKIRQTIKETGYIPARRRRRQGIDPSLQLEYGNIALIWTGSGDSQLTYTGQNMMKGITETLRKLDTSLIVDHIDSTEYIPQALLAGKLDGILIHGPTPEPAICERLKKIPVVWLLQQGSVDFGDRVQPDHTYAGEMAYNYLIRQGCHHLCCMSYTSISSPSEYWKSRSDSFVSHASQNKVNCSLLLHPMSNSPESNQSDLATIAAELVDSFIRLKPKPDGLFVANNLGGYIHSELTKRDISPMQDIILIAGDANVCVQHMYPEPVKLKIFSHQIGKLAVEALMFRIKNPDMPQITYSLKPQLIIPN